MQIDQHIQAAVRAPAPAVLEMLKSLLDHISVFVLQHVVVDRDSDMVEPQPGDRPDILLCDKGVKMNRIVYVKL